VGNFKDHRGINCFTPDNTPEKLYIHCDYSDVSFKELSESMTEHFGPKLNLDEYSISAENIHTHAIGYDLYEPGDYSIFLCITRKKP
jgi:hypothetical protein